jgi:recombination protein RecR
LDYPSKLIEDAVNEVARLPGIGKKTALRLVLHLVKENENKTLALSEALSKMRLNIRFCKTCHNISDDDECFICRSHRRDKSLICVVEEYIAVSGCLPCVRRNHFSHEWDRPR